jgi:uncharacterized YccA/Bax inhibitor family protein
MNFEKTSNPAFSESRLRKLAGDFAGTGQMTVAGAATKTLLLFGLLILTASITWKMAGVGSTALMPCIIGGAIGAVIMAIVACVKPDKAYIFGPLYALCEGLLIGAVSAMYAAAYEGIITSALFLTLAVSGVVFLCYRFGLLRASNTFVKVITFATLGIAAFYLLSFILGFFGINITVFNMGAFGIVIQLIIVGVAALNLVLDFNNIENGAANGVPAQFEWYYAFGLMVTLVWIYMEILRLLAILSRRD